VLVEIAISGLPFRVAAALRRMFFFQRFADGV